MFINPAPLAETVADLRTGQHSLSLYLEQMNLRIARVDPHVQALLAEEQRVQRLQRDAHTLRASYPDPAQRPSLYGCLVGVKDIFHVDGFVTRAGSALPPQSFAGAEAAVVERLRQAGALILGKTVTTEFAYFEPGPTRNPYDLSRTPGGSSSGSAAAVAAGQCQLALGTQTIGSVIRPAAFCGIVGFKPTYNRIPTAGLIYFSPTVDHVGLFTQDIAGMHVAASALCDDWQPVEAPAALPMLGVPTGDYLQQAEPEGMRAFEAQLARLQARGFTVKRVAALDDIATLNHLHRQLAFAEFAREHRDLYAQFQALYRPRTAEIIEIGQQVTQAELEAAGANCARLRTELQSIMADQHFDLWATPAAPGPAPMGIEATGDPNMNLPWTHAGMPTITVPAGLSEAGMPLGLQLSAAHGEDEQLLAWSVLVSEQLDEKSDRD